jgi:hypothetical protein
MQQAPTHEEGVLSCHLLLVTCNPKLKGPFNLQLTTYNSHPVALVLVTATPATAASRGVGGVDGDDRGDLEDS